MLKNEQYPRPFDKKKRSALLRHIPKNQIIKDRPKLMHY